MTSVECVPIGRPAQHRAVHGFRASEFGIFGHWVFRHSSLRGLGWAANGRCPVSATLCGVEDCAVVEEVYWERCQQQNRYQ